MHFRDHKLLIMGLVLLLISGAANVWAACAAGSFKPFTASVLTKYYTDGKLVRTEVQLHAMRADGSMARLVQSVDDKPGGMRIVFDVPRSLRVTIEPVTQSLTTYHWSPRETQNVRDPSRGCRYAPDAPADAMFGVAVRKYGEHWTAGPKEIDEEGWIAPSLGCYALSHSYRVSEFGQEVSHTTSDVISITSGDPPAGLFEVPANYVERKPSEVMALRAEKLGQQSPVPQTALKLDEAYNSRHSQ